ncbi:MAG: hypothetical protein U0797_15390 [Gemmataceae bacterium]
MHHQEPTSPSQCVKGLPRDLVTICLKCLQKRPEQRYASAAALAEDLRRFQAGEPVAARPVSPLGRAWRWARRNPSWAATLGAVAGLLLLVAIGSSLGVVYLNAALGRAKTAESSLGEKVEELEKKDRETQEALFESLVSQADANRLSRRSGQRFRSLELLDRAGDLASKLELPDPKRKALQDATVATLALTDMMLGPGYDSQENRAAFSPDGRLLARLDPKGQLTIHELPAERLLHRVAVPFGRQALLTFDPHGRYLAACLHNVQEGWQAVVWRITPSRVEEVAREPRGYAAVFKPDRPWVALARKPIEKDALGKDDLLVIDLEKQAKWAIRALPPVELNAAFHPSQPLIAVSSHFAQTAQVLEVPSGKVKASIALAENGQGVAWSPDGRLLAVCEQSRVRLHDARTYQLVRELLVAVGGGPVVTFNHRGDRLLVVGWASTWRLFDVHTGRVLFSADPTAMVGISPMFINGDACGAVWQGGKVRQFRVADGRELRALRRATAPAGHGFLNAALLANDRLLAVGGDCGMGLWDLETGEELGALNEGTNVAADPRSGDLYVHLTNGAHRLPVRREGDQILVGPSTRILGPETFGAYFRFSRDGLVRGTYNRQASASVVHLGPRPRTVHLPVADAGWTEVSPDGRWVATAVHPFGPVQIWQASDGKPLLTLPGNGGRPEFSLDGRRLVVWGDPCELWAVETWERQRTFSKGRGVISPDSRWVARDEGNGTIYLERLEDGLELGKLDAPQPGVSKELLLTSDGSRLIDVKQGSNASIHVWDLRLIGQRLRERGLGPHWPTFPPAKEIEPIQLKLDTSPAKKPAWEVILGRVRKAAIAPSPPPPAPAKPPSTDVELALLTLTLTRNPFDADVRYRRGMLLYPGTRRKQAVAHADLSLAILLGHPSTANAYHFRGHLNEWANRWQAAVDDYTAALPGQPPQRGHLLGSRGGCRLRLRQFDEAIAELAEALPLVRASREDHSLVCRDLAHAYLIRPGRLFDLTEALALAKTAVDLLPQRGDNHVTLALAHYRASGYKDAIASAEQGLKLSSPPRRGLALLVLAASHARLGDLAKAKEAQGRLDHWSRSASLLPDQVIELNEFKAEADRAVRETAVR